VVEAGSAGICVYLPSKNLAGKTDGFEGFEGKTIGTDAQLAQRRRFDV
jgi:hypothetical protein